jgi:hypothetical protein
MLCNTMRCFGLVLWVVFTCTSLFGQVHLETPLRFSGSTDNSGIFDLPPPEHHASLMTVNGAVLDQVRLASVTTIGDTIYLASQPGVITSAPGLLLRFIALTDLPGRRWLSVNGSIAMPLTRTDGAPTLNGQILEGSLCEVVSTDDSYILLSPALRGCPLGTLAITERSCIATNSVLGLSFYGAMNHCSSQGGTLCTWGEYVAACYLVGNQLNDMFTNWEWMDDTSNHTQTADQVGRTSCMSQRSAGPLGISASTRCCYRPR